MPLPTIALIRGDDDTCSLREATSRPQAVRHLAVSAKPSLKTNSLWSCGGNSLYAASQWAIIAMLSKKASPAELGVLVYALALATPVFILAQLQLRPIQATDVTGRFSFSTYLTVRVSMIVLALCIVTGLVTSADLTGQLFWTTLAVTGARAAECLSDLFYGTMQQREMMINQSVSLTLKAVLSFTLAAAGFQLTHSALGVATGMFIAWALLVVLYDLPVTLRILRYRASDVSRPRIDASQVWRLLRLAFPLGLVMFLINLSVNIPRYFIKMQSDTAALGIFAALSYVPVAGSVLVNAMGQTVAPRLATHFKRAEIRSFRALLGKLICVSALTGVAAIVIAARWGTLLLSILYKASYAQYSGSFTILLAGAALGYMAAAIGYGLTAADIFKPQLFTTTLSTATLTVSCCLLIPRYGLTGAAVSTVVAAGTSLIANAVLMTPVVLTVSGCTQESGETR